VKVTPEFLRKVQGAGWIVEAIADDAAVCRCQRQGCGMRAKLKEGGPLPSTCGRSWDGAELIVTGYPELQRFLRDRRCILGLSQQAVEQAAGFTDSHLAKAEKDNPFRRFTLENIDTWARTLGYEIVLRPIPLPPITLRILSERSARGR